MENPRLQAVGEVPSGIISANYPSGFYEEDTQIELIMDGRGEIYYTLDCTEPSMEGETSFLYQEMIPLSVSETETVQTIKAKGYYVDVKGEPQETKVFTFTYILGEHVQNRYDTLVLSITGDPDDLFGYENGIFVEGKLWDEFLVEHPDGEGLPFAENRNYRQRGAKSERQVSVQVFDQSGQPLLNQECGLRISGNGTRSLPQKSCQLFARKSYSGNGNFKLLTADDTLHQVDGTIVDKYNRIYLRNNGNDFEHGFIRDSVIQSLAKKSGFEMARQDIPVAVYLNDEYYGFLWMREPFHDGAMRNQYGDYNGEFIVLDLNENARIVVEQVEEEKQRELQPYANEYEEIYDRFATADLNDEELYQDLCNRIDIDNYLRYYAIQLYVGNSDWPTNNVKAYRYVAADGNYVPGTVFDGKYRYILYDTDMTMAIQLHYFGYAVDADTVEQLLRIEHSLLFNSLMARKDCRDMLVNDFCDLMNSGFSPEIACATLLEMEQQRHNELEHFIDDGTLLSEDVSYDTVQAELDVIYDYFANRPAYMYDILEADFPIFYPYYVNVCDTGHAKIAVNHVEDVTEGFRGKYYADCGITLDATVEEGYLFDHWLINGQVYEDQKLALSAKQLEDLLGIPEEAETQDAVSYVDQLDVQVVVKPDTEKDLCIYAVHAKGSDDLVVIKNLSQETIMLSEYYLSVEKDNPKQYVLPNVNLESGECIQLYGKENQNGLKEHRLNFKIKQGDILSLSGKDGATLGEVTIPDLTLEDSFYVRNKWTGSYEEKVSYE